MNRYVFFASSVIALSLVSVSAQGHLPTDDRVNSFQGIGQEESNWCWAACGQMITRALTGYGIPQCTQLYNRYMISCCPGDTSAGLPSADYPGWPEFKRYGIKYKWSFQQGLSWQQIQREISINDTPIAHSYLTSLPGVNSDIHMVVVIGYKLDPTGRRVLTVFDPEPMADSGFDGLPGSPGGKEVVWDYSDRYDPDNIQGLHSYDFFDFSRVQ